MWVWLKRDLPRLAFSDLPLCLPSQTLFGYNEPDRACGIARIRPETLLISNRNSLALLITGTGGRR